LGKYKDDITYITIFLVVVVNKNVLVFNKNTTKNNWKNKKEKLDWKKQQL